MMPWPPCEGKAILRQIGRARPARIDSPRGIGHEVSPSVRNALVLMFQTDSWAACHRPSVWGSSTLLELGNSLGSEGRVTP